VAEIEARFSSREIAEWMAFASLEPFGEERADLRAGIIASVLANIHRDRKRRPEPFSPTDFMPFVELPKTAPPGSSLDREIKAAFRQFEKRRRR
jgi:hypothetical protein